MSAVDICNMALGHLRVPSIQSLTEASEGANQCKLYFDLIRNSSMEAFDWGFCTRTVVLTEHPDDPPPEFEFRYVYPPDCLKIQEILTEASTRRDRPIPYKVESTDSTSVRCILCDVEDAILRYTFKHEDEAQWSALFIRAMAWNLAYEVCMALTGDQGMRDYCWAQYQLSLGEARKAEASQDFPEDRDSALLDSRK